MFLKVWSYSNRVIFCWNRVMRLAIIHSNPILMKVSKTWLYTKRYWKECYGRSRLLNSTSHIIVNRKEPSRNKSSENKNNFEPGNYLKAFSNIEVNRMLHFIVFSCHLSIFRWYTLKNKLRKGFHLIYGTSIGNFILHQRLKLSLPLVESSNLSIKSISLNLGFKSYSHFSTSFKAYFGISPKYYRIQAQSREMEL